MSNAQEKANLARIRDNQRRSRARRKEYLQELEARLRQCELQGIEASAEIQIAARKVADENRKLRALLAQHGVGEDHIDSCLQNNDLAVGQYGGAAVQNLENLLATRKNVCTTRSVPMPTMERSATSRSSSVSGGTVQSSWDKPGHQRLSSKDNGAQQFMTPSSTASSINIRPGSAQSMPTLPQGLGSAVLARNPSPYLGRHASQYDYDPQLSFSNAVSFSMPDHNQAQVASMYMPAVSSTNYNSCVFATDMITTMAGADPQTVRSELGCMPDIDCEVDNQLVFNVMDRYTGL